MSTTIDSHTASPMELDHIEFLVWCTRPGWDRGVIRAALLAHKDQVDAADLAVAALRCARNPEFRTPKAIGWRGPHWDGLHTKPHDTYLRLPTCSICGKREDLCQTTRVGVDDDHEFEPAHYRVSRERAR